jgi:apolipoprotein D and lipocalin family protein
MNALLSLCWLASTLAAPQAADQPVEPVETLDLDRYAGRWYEIARLPNRFQRKCTCCVTATYLLRDDGRVDVVNRCETADGPLEARGVAKRDGDEQPASRLKVRFAPGFVSWLPFVWADYWIIALDPGYAWAVVGEPGRQYLWVLSRTPSLDEATYRALLQRAASMGYDTSKVETTPQGASG